MDVNAPQWRGYFESPRVALSFDSMQPIGPDYEYMEYRPNVPSRTATANVTSGESCHAASWARWIGSACLAAVGASLMRAAARKEYNSNPGLSTPLPVRQTTGRPEGSGTQSAPLPDGMGVRWSPCVSSVRKAATLDTDDIEIVQTQASPASVMDVDDAGNKSASQVDEIGPPGPGADSSYAGENALIRRSHGSRAMLATAANLVRDVYVHLVTNRVFTCSDILENASPLNCPSLDCMGVLFSAQTILRQVLTEELLAAHGLDVQIRELLATVLLMCYKLKSESHWSPSYSITSLVLTQFMQTHELPIRNDAVARAHVEHLEFEMVSKLPIFRLVDETPHAACEWTLYEHYNGIVSRYRCEHAEELARGHLAATCDLRDLKLVCHKELMLCLSGCYFFYHAACLNHEQEVLEQMAVWATVGTMGEALAHISLLALHLVGQKPAPPAIDKTVGRAAALLVKNAYAMSSADAKATKLRTKYKEYGLRTGATADSLHPCQQIVGDQALARLSSALKRYL